MRIWSLQAALPIMFLHYDLFPHHLYSTRKIDYIPQHVL